MMLRCEFVRLSVEGVLHKSSPRAGILDNEYCLTTPYFARPLPGSSVSRQCSYDTSILQVMTMIGTDLTRQMLRYLNYMPGSLQRQQVVILRRPRGRMMTLRTRIRVIMHYSLQTLRCQPHPQRTSLVAQCDSVKSTGQ